MRELGKSYGDRALWDNVTVEISRGERIGIIGPNGSGKTTMLKVLMDKEPSDGGVVGRVKVADDQSPLPRDRFIFNYDHFDDVRLTAGGISVNRYVVGFEKTCLDGGASVEVRVPFADTLNKQLRGDYVVSVNTDADVALVAKSAGAEIANTAGVAVASSVRSDKARIGGKDTGVVGVDPRTITRVYRFDWKQGSDRALFGPRDGALVDENYADKNGLDVGSPLRLQTSSGARATFRVRGIYKVGV